MKTHVLFEPGGGPGLTTRHICGKSIYMKRDTTGTAMDPNVSGPTAATSPTNRTLPKHFMTPWILLCLKHWSAHGYFLMHQLRDLGLPALDHATLYKELRSLEKEGYVTSEWQTDGGGPAKRIYRITSAGEELLRGGADVVAGYQRMIKGFFDLYAETYGATYWASDPKAPPRTKKQKGSSK